LTAYALRAAASERARAAKGCGMDWSDVGLNALPMVLADELTDTRRVA